MIAAGILSLGMKYIESKDKKEQLALDTVQAMLNSKTYKAVDAVVKLAYASEQITKGLVRPLFSCGLFVYGLMNPDVMKQLIELGTVGELAVGGVFGSAPAWGYSRYKEKQSANKHKVTDDDFE